VARIWTERRVFGLTLQATAGFTGCISPDLDKNLANPNLRSHAIAALRHVLAALPADGLVHAADPRFLDRAEHVTTGQPWHCPAALASWVIEVSKALLDLVEGNFLTPRTTSGSSTELGGTSCHAPGAAPSPSSSTGSTRRQMPTT
jgi:hypothetical protein